MAKATESMEQESATPQEGVQDGATGAEESQGTTGAEDGVTAATGEESGAEEGKDKDPKPSDDWRQAIKDEKLREHASRFTSLEDVVRANLESRQKLSKAIVPPGKDASEDDIAAYRKAIGVPADPTGYKFPEVPKEEMTEELAQSREVWAKRFHELNVPAPIAEGLVAAINQDIAAAQAAQVEADKQFAQEQSEALAREWGKDAEKNKTLADRAFVDLASRAGVDIDALRKIETKDGRFVLDRAEFSKIFAVLGREMGEGTLGGVIGEDAREQLQGELDTVRQQISEAQEKGDSKRANQLYQKEQGLIAKMSGSRPVVGAAGRAA